MIIQPGHGYRDILLGQPVERVQQFHVLEVVGGQEQNPALCKHHETDNTPGARRQCRAHAVAFSRSAYKASDKLSLLARPHCELAGRTRAKVTAG
jgi:hypothetical protein